ncbi:MAG: hypothetical protein AAFR25_04015 [Cyanobacteria bacterium J06629_19]
MSEGIGPATGLRQVERKVLLACGGWALLSLLVMGIGLVLPSRPDGYVLAVSLLKIGSFLLATVLCWRNAMHPDILSGRNVWQAIALGMAFYALGDITVMLWRSLWGITSTASLGDVFYGASYLFLAIGLLLAVIPRPINLSLPQTLGISFTGIVGILLASWISFYLPTLNATELLPTGSSEGAIAVNTQTTLTVESKSAAAGGITSSQKSAPVIIQTIDQRLSGIASHLGLLYVVGDCALIVMAVALLVAFWGGSYSEAWKLVAIAGICLYVADMFLIYQIGKGAYRQGAPWEIFWILSALFFGLSAGVEHGVSNQLKQRAARRQWL